MKASPSMTYPRLLHTLLKALVGEKKNTMTLQILKTSLIITPQIKKENKTVQD